MMDQETAERVAEELQALLCLAGAGNYENGIQSTRKLLLWVVDHLESISTPSKLRAELAAMPDPPLEVAQALTHLSPMAPQLIRLASARANTMIQAQIPHKATGRPRALCFDQNTEAINYVLRLFGQGVRLTVAKQRAARHYGCSLRTIERSWRNRGKPDQQPLTPKETIEIIQKIFLS